MLFCSGLALADGWPPFSRDDAAEVRRGGVTSTLTNGSASVLANDFDIERDPLTAILLDDVNHGELTLREDGTFVYRHNGSFEGTDEFYYRAFDGRSFSRATRVSIAILPGDPVPPQITGQQPVSVAEDASLSIDIRSLQVFDPDSTFPRDFTLEVNDGANYTRSGSTITPLANYNGPLSVPVRVFDGTNYSNLFALSVTVEPRNDAPRVVGEPPDQEAIANQPFELSLADYFADIDAGDRLVFSASGLPASRSLSIGSASGVLSGTPTLADARDAAYNVIVTATDNGGASVSLGFALLIQPDDRADLEVTMALAANPVTVGETATWNARVKNLGPADLEEGDLLIEWMTSGPAMSLTVPSSCTLSGNNSRSPSIRCALDGMAAGADTSFSILSVQQEDGDHSALATLVAADDPVTRNNTVLTGGQVVAQFSEGPAQIINLAAGSLAAADFNNDGLLDLAATTPSGSQVYFNSGNRSLSVPGTSLGTNSGGAAVIVLDWNGDGNVDIAVADAQTADVRIYINDGSGGFAQTYGLDVPLAGTVVAAGAADFDRDGDSDIAVTGTSRSLLLTNTGGSNFTVQSLPAAAGIDVAIADLNNDDFPDIIIVTATDRAVRLLRNSGNGRVFSTQSIQRGSVARVTAADVNGDGNVDLLLAVDGAGMEIPESLVLTQTSDGNFPTTASLGASSLRGMLAGDLNADLRADIVAVNEAGVHQVYEGTAGGGFVLNPEQIVSEGIGSAVLLDFNDDQSLDLMLAGRDAGVVEFHANNGAGRLGLGDRLPPVIDLNGDAVVDLPAGASYVEAGATAVDDIDGDLSSAVVITGTVNSTVVGTYTLSYSVADRAGNEAVATRTVKIGVNEGVGGGGGGAASLALLILLLLILVQSQRIGCRVRS